MKQALRHTIRETIARLAAEPPLRILVRALIKRLSLPVRTRALWEISRCPAYLVGISAATEQAMKQRIPEISVIEFGVAGGEGLVAMQEAAAASQTESGVGIRVFGFDM